MLIELQYVRAIAALLVVYFHSVLQIDKLGLASNGGFPLFGESGVDLFFVLSGFVMWLTTSGKQISTAEFYSRRITRIVPLYWTLTLIAAAIALVAPSLLKSTVFDVPHLAASLFFIPWVNPASAEGLIMPVIVPGWTLNCEMYFYLIFGLLLPVAERYRAFALAAAVGGITLLCHLLPASTPTTFYRNPVTLEFVAGVFLADLWLKRRLLPQRLAVIMLPLAFAVMLINDHLHLTAWRALTFGLPAVMAIWSTLSIDWKRFGEWRFLARIGDASYSLYLTHAFVLAGARVAFGHVPEALRSPYLFMLFALAASVAVALVVYNGFEAPVDRALRKFRRRPSPAVNAAELKGL